MSEQFSKIKTSFGLGAFVFLFAVVGFMNIASAVNLLNDPGFENVNVLGCGSSNLPLTAVPWYTVDFPSAAGSPDVFSTDCGVNPGTTLSDLGLFSLTLAHGGLRFAGAGEIAGFVRESFGQTLNAPLTEGQTYVLSGWFSRSDESYAFNGSFEVWLADNVGVDGTLVGEIGADAPIGDWDFYSIEFEAPEHASIIYFTAKNIVAPISYVVCDDLYLDVLETVSDESTTWEMLKLNFR